MNSTSFMAFLHEICFNIMFRSSWHIELTTTEITSEIIALSIVLYIYNYKGPRGPQDLVAQPALTTAVLPFAACPLI